MKKNRFFAFDFDLTLFDTKTMSPRGIGLNEGYEFAVRETFGSRGLDLYREEGGLRNRAPSEVVISLLQKEERLLEYARQKHDELISSRNITCSSLLKDWGREDEIFMLSEMFVYFKLQIFLDEITSSWPLPYPGVVDFLLMVEKLRREGVPLDIGILSSGHLDFITKTFRIWNIPMPPVIVTDDDLRPLKYPKHPKDRVKPAPFPFKLLQYRWLKQLGGNRPVRPSHIQESLPNIIYFGDDLEKDGGLARNARIAFGWFKGNEGGGINAPLDHKENGSFSFNDWARLSDFISQDWVKRSILSDMPLTEIFSRF